MSESRFMRWAEVVGDLGSPFYREERQRDVWNEASAVGFQTMIWLTFVVATASLWIGGRQALPYSFAIIFAIGLSSMITMAYATRKGVQILSKSWVSGRRLAVIGVIYVLMLGGIVRAMWSEVSTTGTRVGMLAGLVSGLLVVAVLGIRARRAVERAESAENAAVDDERV